MNCEHGVDIDEYDCHKCIEFLERHKEKRRKLKLEALAILKENGFSAKIEWARKN